MKVVQINGTRCIINRDAWMKWSVQHITDGHHCFGTDDTLSGLRKGIHAVTSPASREKMRNLFAPVRKVTLDELREQYPSLDPSPPPLPVP